MANKNKAIPNKAINNTGEKFNMMLREISRFFIRVRVKAIPKLMAISPPVVIFLLDTKLNDPIK